MMISNQYQIQPSFQGNLLKKGLKLPQKKFNEVAKIYAEQTKGLPDLTLIGKTQNNDFNGQFYHATSVIIDGNDVASIITKDLKSMFKKLSTEKMAKELVNVTKISESIEKAFSLNKEIDKLKGKIESTRNQLKHTSDPLSAKRLQVLVDNMKANLAKKEAQYEKLLQIKTNASAEWCF